jgi:hypothetical protein
LKVIAYYQVLGRAEGHETQYLPGAFSEPSRAVILTWRC